MCPFGWASAHLLTQGQQSQAEMGGFCRADRSRETCGAVIENDIGNSKHLMFLSVFQIEPGPSQTEKQEDTLTSKMLTNIYWLF